MPDAPAPTRSTFVRALWGDALLRRSRTKTIRDLRISRTYLYPVAPVAVFAFGRENARLLHEAGYEDVVLLSRVGIVNFFGRSRRRAGPIHNWGCNMWRHKLAAIAVALETADEAVWLDWDCHALLPLPGDFWERVRAGADLQGSLRQYARLKCLWRRGPGRRLVPGGAWIYCRGREAAAELLAVQAEHRTWDDEIALAYTIDRRLGGWPGIAGYQAAGHEPYCYRIRGQCRPPEQALFTAG